MNTKIKKSFTRIANTLMVLFVLVALGSCKSSNDSASSNDNTNRIDLSGTWQVKLDALDEGEKQSWQTGEIAGETIELPGTLDDAELGTADTLTPALNNYVLSSLSRKHQYIGKAWYQKQVTIPEDWSGKTIDLKLERVLWQSTVFIDDQKVDSRESLIGSHDYELATYLTPGIHTLTIVIDNSDFYPNINVTGDRYPIEVNQEMAHAYTNHTQIKWNGILGDIALTASDKATLSNLEVYPDVSSNTLEVVFESNQAASEKLTFEILKADGTSIFSKKVAEPAIEGKTVRFSISKPDNLELWDEFNPVVYQAVIGNGKEKLHQNFGFRTLSRDGAELQLNKHRIFLRGNLECVIFPLTGHPPMKTEEWATLYKQAKNYGLNHIRFHSWCPPEAAFQAADEVGMYLQVELPHWSLKVGEDAQTTVFLQREADKILKDYGKHPSFLFLSMGNELEGDFSVLNELAADLKQKDPRHLYATTSFSFQKPAGTRPETEDDFFIAQWTDKGWIRGQGVFNDYSPNFNKDFTANSAHIEVPLISHEIGQYSVYPDLSEIPKYTGVLAPLNFVAVKNDLEKKGLLDLAPDFTYASGKLAAMLYKEEIERALKTPSFDGFQLLQLQDFPGQGTALVGLLNAFWESKGVISGEEFRQFNSPLVPLARFEKAVYESGETFETGIEVANFFEPKTNQQLKISLKNQDGNVLKEEVLENVDLSIGNNTNLGTFEFPINVEKAEAWSLEISLMNSEYKNHWPIWVYPKKENLDTEAVTETRSFQEALKLLDEGKTVLLNPDYKELNGVTGRFVPVFWSPVHFPDQPATMGLLIKDEHQALSQFPTEKYTQWQWWDLCKQSTSVILDGLDVDPIVNVIDNFVTNRKLGNVFEAKVGSGKLIFSSMDISTDLANRPAARQLRTSLLKYMSDRAFNPQQEVTKNELMGLKAINVKSE